MTAAKLFERRNVALLVVGTVAGVVFGVLLPPQLLWVKPYLAVVALAPVFIRTAGVLRYVAFAATYCALTFVLTQFV